MIVDHVEEFERRGETDIGDRRMIAADDGFLVRVEGMQHMQRLGERRDRGLLSCCLIKEQYCNANGRSSPIHAR